MVGLLCLFGGLSGGVLAAEVPHEHPDEVSGDGDLESVEQWLSGQMGEIHADCADGITIGSFDACEDLDDEYTDLLDRYATVETDRRSNTDTAERYNETRSQQQEYAALRKEFDATFEEYEAARAAGNDAEARRLARELQQLALRIEALGGEIEVNFTELDNTTSVDLSEAAASINKSTNETRTIRLSVEAESFDETIITANAGVGASFAEPTTVSGTVTTLNGTGIAEGAIVVSDDAQSFRTTTTANGSFELLYRPAVTSVGTTNLTIQYQPANGDPYLRSDTTTPIQVNSTASQLHVKNTSGQVAFNDQLVVTGMVQAAGTTPPGVAVRIRSDGGLTATSQTGSDGSFKAVTRVPATVKTGTQSINVQASAIGRAIEPSKDSIEFTVKETETELRLSATATDGKIDLSGRLTADTDAEVGPRPVTVHLGDETYAIQTDEKGRYNITVEPASVPDTVSATYNEAGTNLAASRGETTLAANAGVIGNLLATVARFGNGVLAVIKAYPIMSVFAGGVLITILIVVARRLRSWSPLQQPRDRIDRNLSEEVTTESTNMGTSPTVETLLETAQSKLQTNPQIAIYASYVAVRTLLGASAEQTHRDLYKNQQSVDNDRAKDALYTLTQAFEQAAFAPEDIETGQAKSALQAAERYLDYASRDGPID